MVKQVRCTHDSPHLHSPPISQWPALRPGTPHSRFLAPASDTNISGSFLSVLGPHRSQLGLKSRAALGSPAPRNKADPLGSRGGPRGGKVGAHAGRSGLASTDRSRRGRGHRGIRDVGHLRGGGAALGRPGPAAQVPLVPNLNRDPAET